MLTLLQLLAGDIQTETATTKSMKIHFASGSWAF